MLHMATVVRPGGRVSLWSLILLLAAALGGAGIAIFRQSRIISELRSHIDQGNSQNQELRTRLEKLTQETQAAATRPAPAPSSISGVGAGVGTPQHSEFVQIASLRESLARAEARTAELESRLSDLQAQMAALSTENRRLSGAAEELTRSLSDANQSVNALRSELKTSADRLAQTEGLNAKLREEASNGRQSVTQFTQTMADLEGIFRRRDMYVNNALRRYKEVTEQYRSMAGVLDARHDREAAPLNGAELSRIQNTIAMAEEDLKQISALNVQASRLEKKLGMK